MGRLVILGSASCIPQRSRSSTALLLDVDDGIYLMDCGGCTPRDIVRAGYELKDIGAILLSHTHGDHILGMPDLLMSMHLLKRERELQIFGPGGTEDTIISLCEISYHGFMKKDDLFRIEFNELDGERIEFDSSLGAASGDHSVPSYGFRVGDVVYSGDTRPCERITALSRGARVLVHEASVTSELEELANRHGHCSARQAGMVARDAGVEMLILVHIESMYEGREKLLADEAGRVFHGEVLVGADLVNIKI